jgi:hypothetical protein
MHKATSYQLSRAVGEKLLDGGAGPGPLAHFLATAAGPGTAIELRGENVALSAFSTAVLTRSSPRRMPEGTRPLGERARRRRGLRVY